MSTLHIHVHTHDTRSVEEARRRRDKLQQEAEALFEQIDRIREQGGGVPWKLEEELKHCYAQIKGLNIIIARGAEK